MLTSKRLLANQLGHYASVDHVITKHEYKHMLIHSRGRPQNKIMMLASQVRMASPAVASGRWIHQNKYSYSLRWWIQLPWLPADIPQLGIGIDHWNHLRHWVSLSFFAPLCRVFQVVSQLRRSAKNCARKNRGKARSGKARSFLALTLEPPPHLFRSFILSSSDLPRASLSEFFTFNIFSVLAGYDMGK